MAQQSEILDRAPPADPAAEKRLLGSILREPSILRDVVPLVRPEDFHLAKCGTVFGHMLQMAESANGQGPAIDITLLWDCLKRAGDAGGPDEPSKISQADVAELLEDTPTADYAVTYAGLIREKARLRRLIHTGTEILRDGYSELPSIDVAGRAAAELEKIEADGTQQSHFEPVTCPTLLGTEYAVKWLIDWHLAAGAPAFVGGPAKSCKTLVALDAAISLVSGEPFLGKFAVANPIRVAYFSGEGGLSTLQEYVRRICDAKGISGDDLEGLIFSEKLPRLDSESEVTALKTFLQREGVGVAFLDPLYLALGGDGAENLIKMGGLLQRLNAVCVGTGTTPILIHHLRKNLANPYSPPELADLSWAGFQEFSGQWWLIARQEKYEPDQPGEHRLWLNCGGRTGQSALHALEISEGSLHDPGGRSWSVTVERAADARRRAADREDSQQDEARARRLEGDKRKLTQAAAHFPEGESKRTLANRAGLPWTRMTTALGELLEDGGLEECEILTGNHKTPSLGYKLVVADDTP